MRARSSWKTRRQDAIAVILKDTLAVLLALGVSAVGPRLAGALPASVDADGDGWTDRIETNLGSNPGDAASTPESVATPPSCLDGVDNDLDGRVDGADPGCTATAPVTDAFPATAGLDVFDSALTLDAYPLATTSFGTCMIDFDARGPTVVQRSAPIDTGGGVRRIDTEIVALELRGTATVLAGGTCRIPPADYKVTMFEDPAHRSRGSVTARSAGKDFPADSFFDVFFDIDTPVGVLPGGPPNGPPGASVRVTNVVNGIPPYHSSDNSLCYSVPGLAHKHCPKAPPDHFKCYSGKFPRFKPRGVTLVDQFGQTNSRVLKPIFFCNPAAKNGEPLFDKAAHLQCYALKPQKIDHPVLVRNQFGFANVTPKKSVMLCNPAQKNGSALPPELDHYKCYTGKFPKMAPRPVTLVDQFHTEQTQVMKPLMLCNPVRKDGLPVHDPLAHLECFKLRPQRFRTTITAQDQFGQGQVSIRRAEMLCVPTAKFEGGPTTTTTTTTTTTLPGRAVTLAHPTGSLTPGTVVCLSRVQGGCVAPVHLPNCSCVHLHNDVTIDGKGPFRDPEFQFNDPCGHGCVTNAPGCGPDSLPPC